MQLFGLFFSSVKLKALLVFRYLDIEGKGKRAHRYEHSYQFLNGVNVHSLNAPARHYNIIVLEILGIWYVTTNFVSYCSQNDCLFPYSRNNSTNEI